MKPTFGQTHGDKSESNGWFWTAIAVGCVITMALPGGWKYIIVLPATDVFLMNRWSMTSQPFVRAAIHLSPMSSVGIVTPTKRRYLYPSKCPLSVQEER
jgi:hypothetical protein